MDLTQLKTSAVEWVKKYRLGMAAVLCGILLLISLPEGKGQKAAPEPAPQIQEEETLEQQLEMILGKVEGAGKVKLLLTVAYGSQTHYQNDETASKDPDTQDLRRETVLITDSSRDQKGLIQRIDPPKYLGAVVLSQGADRASVRLALMEAVKTATGLTADKISVLKMK